MRRPITWRWGRSICALIHDTSPPHCVLPPEFRIPDLSTIPDCYRPRLIDTQAREGTQRIPLGNVGSAWHDHARDQHTRRDAAPA